MRSSPDLSKLIEWTRYVSSEKADMDETKQLQQEAKEFLNFYDWCVDIVECYAGMLYPGIVAVFLFKIEPSRADVDEWVWVIVGDLPPAYITTDEFPNPATALDGYIGAMFDWVNAAQQGKSVANLIPVNVPATKENADMLKQRLEFLDNRVLSEYKDDLKL